MSEESRAASCSIQQMPPTVDRECPLPRGKVNNGIAV